MEVAVWDTYVTKKDGEVMHFDIIAPKTVRDATLIHQFGKRVFENEGSSGSGLDGERMYLLPHRKRQQGHGEGD